MIDLIFCETGLSINPAPNSPLKSNIIRYVVVLHIKTEKQFSFIVTPEPISNPAYLNLRSHR